MSLKPCWLPTTIGSLPYTSAAEALQAVMRFTPEIPAWPQLPRRSPLENMYAQYTELFPGVEVTDGQVRVVIDDAFRTGLERLYLDYVEENVDRYLPSVSRAPGLRMMVDTLLAQTDRPTAVKGQLTGPISLAMQVTDQDLKPLLYDEIAFDAVSRYLRLVARAQEKVLSQISPTTIVFLDEPYLNAYGSALFSLSREQVVNGLEEVFQGIKGLKGVHCCGNTDWSVVLSTSLDILSFDAYHFAETLALYPDDLKAFLNRGGVLAWGIVPAEEQLLAGEDTRSLVERLMARLQLLRNKGIPDEYLAAQSLVTPSCGLGSLSVPAAEKALDLVAQVSKEARARLTDSRAC
ncbi:MAG: methionine synthase [Chloroflexi bacterium]|nr:methionine synthase [Chloroflexota bacterium]